MQQQFSLTTNNCSLFKRLVQFNRRCKLVKIPGFLRLELHFFLLKLELQAVVKSKFTMKCEPPGRQTIIYITETFESFSERSTYHMYICLIVLPALPKSSMHTIYDLIFTKGITILQEETSNKYQEEIISFNIKSFPLNLVQFTKAEMFY